MKAPWRTPGVTLQLLTLLVIGLAISHAIGLLVLSREQGEVHPLARDKVVELFARLAQATAPMDPASANAVLARASDGDNRLAVGPEPWPLPAGLADPGHGQDGPAITSQLHGLLGNVAQQARICIGPDCAPPRAQNGPPGRPMQPLVLQLPRPDGQWTQATLWIEERTRWWWPVSFWLQLSLIPVFLAAAFALRQLARPARALVAAAGRVSRGEYVAPLRVQGPREMREVTQAFNQMQERIAHHLKDRTQMLAAISHDFRTPITSLRLRAEMVADEPLRAAMVRTLDDMRRMVDETLRWTRDDAAAAQEPTVEVDLRQLLDGIVAEQAALGRDVRWAGPPPAARPYRCRPLSVQRACHNLVDNAVRYGQRARLGLAADADGRWLHIDIDDDGPGIAAEHREAAFVPFFRLPQAAGTAGEATPAAAEAGIGLGLTIARSCARAHGGNVRLMPLPDGRHGLRARIELPLDATDPPALPAALQRK